MYTLYLIGPVSADPMTHTWRKTVEKYFKSSKWIKILNPCASKFNQSLLKNNTDNESSYFKEALKDKGAQLLPHKDREYVRQSNVTFVNMNMYTPEKPIIGSFFELAWYFDAPEKMVIGIFDGDPEKDFQCNHPFVKETVQAWVKTPREACELLERFMDVKN